MFLVEILAGLNIVVMIGAGVVTVSKTNEMIGEFKEAVKVQDKMIRILDKRVTVIETVCAINHPGSAKELLTLQD